MHMYICITYVYVYMCICVYVYMYVCMYVYPYAYVCFRVCTVIITADLCSCFRQLGTTSTFSLQPSTHDLHLQRTFVCLQLKDHVLPTNQPTTIHVVLE